MPKRNNAIAKKGFKDKPSTNDDINFHPVVADLTFKYLKPHYDYIKDPLILDACSGINGILGKSLLNQYKSNNKGTLILQDILIDGTSILDFTFDVKFDIILCNTRWSPVEFTEKVFHYLYDNLLDNNGVMFFVVNNTFIYSGWKRGIKLNYQKFYFYPRYVFKHAKKPLLDCGVITAHKGEIPLKTIDLKPFIYIPNNYMSLENNMFDLIGEKNEIISCSY